MQKWKILIETNEAFAYPHLRIQNKTHKKNRKRSLQNTCTELKKKTTKNWNTDLNILHLEMKSGQTPGQNMRFNGLTVP